MFTTTPDTWDALEKGYHDDPDARKKPQPFPLEIPALTHVFRSYSREHDGAFLAAGLYTTGQRVNEFLKLKRADVNQVWKNERPYLQVNSITLKNRQTPFRQILAPFNRADNELVTYFWERVKRVKDPETPLFNRSVRTARNYLAEQVVDVGAFDLNTRSFLKIKLALHPHYFRHCRASILCPELGYLASMKFFGWSTGRMADLYCNGTLSILSRQFEKTPLDADPNSPDYVKKEGTT